MHWHHYSSQIVYRNIDCTIEIVCSVSSDVFLCRRNVGLVKQWDVPDTDIARGAIVARSWWISNEFTMHFTWKQLSAVGVNEMVRDPSELPEIIYQSSRAISASTKGNNMSHCGCCGRNKWLFPPTELRLKIIARIMQNDETTGLRLVGLVYVHIYGFRGFYDRSEQNTKKYICLGIIYGDGLIAEADNQPFYFQYGITRIPGSYYPVLAYMTAN